MPDARSKGPRPGDVTIINNIELVARLRDGKIVWEPNQPFQSDLDRDAAKKREKDEIRWMKEREADISKQRLAEAKQVQRAEQKRKEILLGNNGHGNARRREVIVKPSNLLVRTRDEEAQARAKGLDVSAPGQYRFLKESLSALEKEYAAQQHEARQKAYNMNRQRLGVRGGRSATEAGDKDDDNVDQLRARLATMSDDEFKALAQARKQRAKEDLSSIETKVSTCQRAEVDRRQNAREKAASSHNYTSSSNAPGQPPKNAQSNNGRKEGKAPNGKGAGGSGRGSGSGRGGRGKGKVKVRVNPKHDPDYCR